jgi:hypothetical protein
MQHTAVMQNSGKKNPEGSIIFSCGCLLIKEKKVIRNSVKYYFVEAHILRVMF